MVPTAKSAINVSSLSPDRWDIIVLYPMVCANLITSKVSETVPIWFSLIKIELEEIFKKPFFKVGYISIIGVAVSAYHIFLQNGGGGGGTCAVDVPCDMKYVDIFGFISIPVMAGTGFLTIFVALLYYDFARKELVE